MNLFKRWWESIRRLFSQAGGHSSEFLCDSCRYDSPTTCNHRERPNAKKCADYRRRG